MTACSALPIVIFRHFVFLPATNVDWVTLSPGTGDGFGLVVNFLGTLSGAIVAIAISRSVLHRGYVLVYSFYLLMYDKLLWWAFLLVARCQYIIVTSN